MSAAFDYIRLGSWDDADYPYTVGEVLARYPAGWERGKWLQYKGWRKEQMFVGAGLQKNVRHFIVQFSGSLSDDNADFFYELSSWYATRIDLQVTIPKPDFVDLPALHKELGKDKTTLISSEENDTLYFGKRTSDIFVRLYEKPLEKMYLRMEFEFKGRLSKAIFEAMRLGESRQTIFNHYLNKLRIPGNYRELFYDDDADETQRAITAQRNHDNEKTIAWINSLDGCMMRHMASHDIGESVKLIIRGWSKFADKLDTH